MGTTPPSDRPLQVHVTHVERAAVVRIEGSATASDPQTAALGDVLESLADRPTPLTVVDVEDLDFIGSVGLGALVVGYLRHHRRDGRILLAAPKANVREEIEKTCLDVLLPMFASVEDALSAASGDHG